MRALALDTQVEQRFLEALRPDQLTLALAALAQLEQEEHAETKQWELRLERVRYQAQRAERQYQAVEPENRLVARSLNNEEPSGGLWDRMGTRWFVFDVDGTREAARQRALPQTLDRPAPQRRLRPLCAPGYTGRKRGEVVRTRTTILQAHTHQWLGTFGNPGNGQHREDLRRAVAVIQGYVQAHDLPQAHAMLRLDGHYGTAAVLGDLVGLAFVMRGKDYQLLDRPEVQARLHLPADQPFAREGPVGLLARSMTALTSL